MAETSNTEGSVLVVGGGIAGMQAALDLVESGFYVYVADSAPAIGGHMAQLDKTFPTNDCAMCTEAPRLVDVANDLNIEVLTLTDVLAIEGEPGNFTVHLRKRARYVDEIRCTGCGDCIAKCPVKNLPDAFNLGIDNRTAIYKLYPQGVPNVAVIDAEHCLKLTKDKCGICERVCQAKAINYEAQDEVVTVHVGGVIVAGGYEMSESGTRSEYGHGRYANVITGLAFERYLSASGPTNGHVVRPSDQQTPKRIAFIQCVGSRDITSRGNGYCSQVCCMYSTKHAIIAKEHEKGVEATIFYIDLRAHGKGCENYYISAEKDYGVEFIRSMVPAVRENPADKSLTLAYLGGDGERIEREFDLVVLATAMEPSPGMAELARNLDLKLDDYGFIRTQETDPIATSREAIYAVGLSSGPKDIPDSVMQASAAAGRVGAIIASARGSRLVEKTYPPLEVIEGQEPRVGVFVCHCGINIAGVIDVEALAEYAKTLPGVVHSDHIMYSCSPDGLDTIRSAITEHKLNRVVVAACTPRTHEPLFQETLREAGINRYLFELANIRDQCSWVHSADEARATEKARDLIRSAIAKAALAEPLYTVPISNTQRCLVIGGGAAGMTAALTVAGQGYGVSLIERDAELGGHLRSIRTLLGGDAPQELLADLRRRVDEHPLVDVHLETTLKEISGFVGNFKSVLATNGSTTEIEHGTIIVAAGAKSYEPTEYLYGENARVVTQFQLEAGLAGGTLPIDDGSTVVMIQCVGNRTDERPYCGRVCCAQAVKNAIAIKEKHPRAVVHVLYRDLRVFGLYEQYYLAARKLGVIFTRYDDDDPPKVSAGDKLSVTVNDLVRGEPMHISADLLVLSVGVVADEAHEALGMQLKVPRTSDGFFLEAHVKLRPVDFATEGMFVCGLAHFPKMLGESIFQAQAAAGRALTTMSQEQLTASAVVAQVEPEMCKQCLACVRSCPYNVPKMTHMHYVQIEPAECQGCGICVAECPAKAIQLRRFTDAQIMAQAHAVMNET